MLERAARGTTIALGYQRNEPPAASAAGGSSLWRTANYITTRCW